MSSRARLARAVILLTAGIAHGCTSEESPPNAVQDSPSDHAAQTPLAPAPAPEAPAPAPPDYSAETSVAGYTIGVTLFRNHPFLAEYRKVVTVTHRERAVARKELVDPGGIASFYLLRRENEIVIVDGLQRGLVLDVTTGGVSDVDPRVIPRDFPSRSFGRFMFVPHPVREYRWLLQEELPDWAK